LKPLDKIALIIAATAAIILVMISLGPMVTGVPLTDAKAQIVGNLISSFIAILSMYVGAQLKARADEEDVPKAGVSGGSDGLERRAGRE
jgi:hypothetical protein